MQNKPIYLFLDDDAFRADKIRNPEIYYPIIGADHLLEKMKSYDVVKVTTVEDAISWIEKNKCPDFISFDNDLQKKLEGKDLAKWLVEKDLDEPGFIPSHFEYFVHSQNVSAKKDIVSLLDQYLDYKKQTAKKLKP